MSPTAIGFLLIAVVLVILLLAMIIGRNGTTNSPTNTGGPTNSNTNSPTTPPTIWERKYWAGKLDKLTQWSLDQKKFWTILGSWILLNLAAALMVSFLYFPWLQSFGLWLGVQVGFIVYASTDKIWLKRVVIICGLIGFITAILGLEVRPWQSDGLAKIFKIQMKEKMWDDAKETARLLGEPQRSDWLDEVVDAQIEENLIIEARDTANIMAELRRSGRLAEIFEIQTKEKDLKGAKETRTLLAQGQPKEIDSEKKAATQTRFSFTNPWFGWQDEEVKPAELVDTVEGWWETRQQAKAIAEAKAREVVWKGEQIIVAPVTDDWSKAAEATIPRSNTWKTEIVGPNQNGRWEIRYEERSSGEVKTFIGGGPDVDKKIGPKLPANSPIKFRSLESEPLNILVQWR